MTAIRLRPVEGGVFVAPCQTRLPFRFGMVTMTTAPLATCHLRVEFEDGSTGSGYASDLLVPKWFEKNPDQPVTRDWADLLAAQRRAIDLAITERAPGSAFEHWRRLYGDLVESRPRTAGDLLVAGEGVSLVERAIIDAVCRHASLPFARAAATGALGLDPAAVDPSLEGWSLGESLPRPAQSMDLRHTVGLADAIEPGDVADRVGDGLPECLADDIRAFGLTHFKIKVVGNTEDQAERLARVWSTIRREAGAGARVTLDGNEQFESVESFVGLLRRIERDPRLDGFLDALLLIEQPLHRARTFDPDANRGMDRLAEFAPGIIDEADLGLWALPEAAALGYRGVSIKNCKGVFRAIINRARCDRSGGRLFQSGEDLTNLPVLALQQDLATMAALGVTHVERNGHHYFRGLDHLPPGEQTAAIAAHPDLYAGSPGAATLRIERGRLALGSLLAAPGFGYAGPIDLEARVPADAWDPASMM